MALMVERAASPRALSVVGIDDHPDPRLVGVKLDMAEVPLHRAEPLLRAAGAQPESFHFLRTTARTLRMPALSYLGLKFSSQGPNGYKASWGYEPVLGRRADQPYLVAPTADRPGRRATAFAASTFTPLSFGEESTMFPDVC